MSVLPVAISPRRSRGASPAVPSTLMEAPISPPDCIAVINAGSSSVKFALYAATGEADLLFRGQVEGLGVAPHLRIARPGQSCGRPDLACRRLQPRGSDARDPHHRPAADW